MALTPRLDIRQSQSLVMTPQLQQAIKLLTLSSLEIEAYVAEAVERNPLLETSNPDAMTDRGERSSGEPQDNKPAEQTRSDEALQSGEMASGEALDVNYSSDDFTGEDIGGHTQGSDGMLGLSGNGSVSVTGSGDFADGPDFDSFAAPEISLRDHLLLQAGASLIGQEYLLVSQLIDHIEPTGYLGADLLATAHRLGVSLADMETALSKLQGFDPTGVGARDLAECLALQAKEADRYDPCMERLIANLDIVARGGFDQLKRICRVDDEDLRDMLHELRGYNPKPGCDFDQDTALAITPDIFVAAQNTGWSVELNSANLPKLLINRSYVAELSAGRDGMGADAATKNWLNDSLADAHWLIKAMDQRQRTIIKVASEIVKQQDRFFREGLAHLRPLTLRQVAEAIEMHESTVSRVTSNKYLSCARGVFELKFFFSSGVASSDGEGASAQAIKSHIKTLIDGEGSKILSDDKLVTILQQQGFDLARRTVAKYREAMGLGSSVQRRRSKKMNG
jgi:RNA polymerase sigma-54 factor